MPKISIVVPIYNIQDYLTACLTSLKNQSFEDIEIIMVNDGSTDGSPQIAQTFANNDSRFTLVHQENGGLSAARNTGLRKAQGEFVFYLDSDDYLQTDCLEKLIQAQKTFDADIVQANFYYDYPDHLLYNNKLKGETIVINQQEAVEGVIAQQEIKNFAWGKLIRRSIAQRHEFPKGLFFEDTLWKYQVIKEVKTYVLVGEPLLFYLQRGASISGSFSLKNLDQLRLYAQRLDLIQAQESEFIFQKALGAFNQNIIQHEGLLNQLNEADRRIYSQQIDYYKIKYNLEGQVENAYKRKVETFWKKVRGRLFGKSYYKKLRK